jgi:oligopeptide/dipeptide ABC transporter ATP-binding protein
LSSADGGGDGVRSTGDLPVAGLEPGRGVPGTVADGKPEALLTVEELSTEFRTPAGMVHAVDEVSFSLARGRTLGIVGESGSGKTVLSRSVMGLLPKTAIRSGRVLFDGVDLAGLSDRDMRRYWGTEIAMVFQDPMTALNPVVKVGRQITESLIYHLEISKEEAQSTAVELLRSVGMPEPARRLKEYPHQLSGGMRQRVVIAIALACSPKLLIADEPTTALDVTVQAQILDLLARLQRERHMAMMFITHDLGVVSGRTDDTAVMYAGRVVEKAPTRALFADMKMPYTEALMKSIPRLEYPSHSRLLAITGRPPSLINLPKGCRFAPRCPYAQERCREEEPPLRDAQTPGHQYRCWYPVGTPEGHAALERNLQAGQTAVGTTLDPSVAEIEVGA